MAEVPRAEQVEAFRRAAEAWAPAMRALAAEWVALLPVCEAAMVERRARLRRMRSEYRRRTRRQGRR